MDNQGEPRKQVNIGITLFPPKDEKLSSINARFVSLFVPLAQKIFVIGGNLPKPDDVHIKVIHLHKWASSSSILAKASVLFLLQIDTCFKLIRVARHCDIVILASLGELEIMPLLIAKLFRKKVAIVQGGTYVSGFRQIYGNKWWGLGKIIPAVTKLFALITHGLVDGIIVDTMEEAEYFGLSKYKKKIFVCGITYIDTNIFRVQKDPDNRRKVVGYVGRFSPEKGVMNLVKAIPLILNKQPGVEFLLCGDGPLFNEVKKEIENSKTSNSVTFTGRTPLEKIPDYLNEMCLLVIPSYVEGLPKVLLESMACGTPVLVTPAGGMPHLIKNEETGFILESNSPEHIARDVIKALHHPKLHEIAEAARKLIENKYTYEPVVKSWANAFQELMKRRREL